MDNPHTLDVEAAYLAGLIDGEGTVTIERTGNRRLNGITGLSPRIIVANTNEAIIQRTVNIYQRIGVNPHIRVNDQRATWKVCYQVSVQGLAKVKKVLLVVMPYLTGKIGQARLIMDFIEYRGDPVLAKGKPYGSYETGILDRVRALNSRGVTETEDYGLARTARVRQMTVHPVVKAADTDAGSALLGQT